MHKWYYYLFSGIIIHLVLVLTKVLTIRLFKLCSIFELGKTEATKISLENSINNSAFLLHFKNNNSITSKILKYL